MPLRTTLLPTAALTASLALAGGVATTTTAAAAPATRHVERRHGGTVHAVAWPQSTTAPAPSTRLARWLARQVGPITLAKHAAKRAPARRELAVAAAASTTAASPTVTTTTAASGAVARLLLVRSFDIPTTDALYGSLSNYSWTYDNGLAVFAFLSNNDKTEATQLLDQLAALQNADGSLDFAYDVATGAGSGLVRSGSVAWVGLAAAAYRRLYSSTRYDTLISGIVRYLLALRTSDGLVKGGPDVSWVSTQHNLLTVGLLRDLQDQLAGTTTKLGGLDSNGFNTAQNTMGNALLSKTLVQDGALAHFTEGVGDPREPADVQALGAMYLKLRGDGRATAVANTLQQAAFTLGPRKTTAGAGPYTGIRPYLDATSPSVIWTEGTAETELALIRLGISNSTITNGIYSLASSFTSAAAGPIGADRDITDPSWGEYHTWPTSAAASWLLILGGSQSLLFAH